jgi:hypothetical protein
MPPARDSHRQSGPSGVRSSATGERLCSATAVSEAARILLHRRLAGERVAVTGETRPLYHELSDAGLMIPLYTFALRRDSAYRPSDAACALRANLSRTSSPTPSS